MSKEQKTLAKAAPKGFSLHDPNQALTEKDLEARFKNLKTLLAKAHKGADKRKKF